MKKNYNEELLDFISRSPSTYHVIKNFEDMLCDAGYIYLPEEENWTLSLGGKYCTARSGSSLIAFSLPDCSPSAFLISAAHSDSPAFKIKDNSMRKTGKTLSLETEKYGGMLMNTWFDRPLSVAGRAIIKTEKGLSSQLVDIDRDLVIIPSVAIHMNRNANDGVKLAANVDTIPLYGAENSPSLISLVAEKLSVEEKDIFGHDLFLYLREKGTVLGENGQFIASPKLDDLMCAFALIKGLIGSACGSAVNMACIFDNEEVGSGTKQGAASFFMRDIMARIAAGLGLSDEDRQVMLARSFMISADNAHAIHPNHPEYSDKNNAPEMNGGVVIKYNANQRYSTDGVSAAIFKSVCDEAGVKYQVYANRSDMAGGSTLGSISNTMVPLRTVDIGLAQLSMHSAYETAGAEDLSSLIGVMEKYYSKNGFGAL